MRRAFTGRRSKSGRMRGERTLSLVLLCLCLGVGSTACSGTRQSAAASSSPPASAPKAHAAVPTDPDLASVMERFYQQVEGQHWKFAYAMLSPRYQRTLSQSAFVDQYADLVNPDVRLQQKTNRVVVASLFARDRLDRARRYSLEETVTLAWDGEQWVIDGVRRRSLNAADTR
jgi:hypothetical protein